MKMIVDLTDRAKGQFLKVLAQKGKKAIKIGIETKGCSGKSYTMMYADSKDPLDEVIPLSDDAFLYIDPKAALFMIGTQIDFEIDDMGSQFVFNNPNEKGRCGCGKSFHV